MEESKPIDEAELIKHGKEMIVNGLGSTFVYKWVRDRVDDQETRSRIIDKIHNIDGQRGKTAPSQEEVIKARRIRQGKYTYEDCLESIEKVSLIGKVCLLFGFGYFISSLISGGTSLPNAIISIVTGAALLFTPTVCNFRINAIVATIAGIYLFSVLIEFLLFGLPGPLIPGFGEFSNVKIIHAVTLVNDFSPLIYILIKIILAGLFFKVIYMNNQVKEIPKNIKLELGIKEVE